MATYTEAFRECAVRFLINLTKEGTVEVDSDIYVNNVRELVAFLGISSYSLYKWQREFGYKGIDVETIETRYTDEEIKSLEEQEESWNNPISEIPSIDVDLWESKALKKGKTETIIDDGNIIMELDNTYFMTLARALKVKNYRMPLKQLYVAIGNELIKRSGLVENGVKKQLRAK